jgi:hypothetical protein
MEVHLDPEGAAMARRGCKGKRRRPQGRIAAAPADIAAWTGRVLAEREAEWLERLARDPASFTAVEREVHDQVRLPEAWPAHAADGPTGCAHTAVTAPR